MRPSFISSAISGTIILIALIMYIVNITKFKITKNIMILLLLGIGFGVHSICHYYEEIYFNYNPFIGKWKIDDEPKLPSQI
jgi:hypothetical protein